MCVCVVVVEQLIVQPASADLNRPQSDRAAGFKSDDSESEVPFTLQLQICECENLFQDLRQQNAKNCKNEASNLNLDVMHNDEEATNGDASGWLKVKMLVFYTTGTQQLKVVSPLIQDDHP